MPTHFFAHLSDRALIRVGGPEAQHFLQNLVTSDIDTVDKTGASAGALLTPQGKILFDFLIYKAEDGYLLDTPAATAPDFLKRLTFYRLRAKVDLELLDAGTGVLAVWGEPVETATAELRVTDPRLEALGQRLVGPVTEMTSELDDSDAGLAAYHTHRIGLGVPEGLQDYDYSEIFPHDADLDQLGGVSFSKGCYVGQEVVSRVQHRGTARKRFVQIESSGPLPGKGSDVKAGGKTIGTLGSSTTSEAGSTGLALMRLDKVVQAKDNGSLLECGDAEILVKLPEWAGFSLPEPGAAD
ncbi:folate-binding protein YgfZ [Labrenzia sp. VG12]|uniref:CAF17-like 4Fe-4S cluster assembly/insertion protein YgfZ n=1 Tax=Labrenzia sp. VG12 TaxID=2021862 RepID=UPI000B8C5B6A|nr:folate-binding protein YgfZ [Labrenzia sp. VG12]ASP36300.1 folate-binding protein YgfZ [Labrenzia sp. VG12]